ncbi:MAG: ATP-binding protein [Candidatus Thiodiazotropha sp.]
MEYVNHNASSEKSVSTTGDVAVETLKIRSPNLRWLFWLPALLAAVIVGLMLAALVLVSAQSLQRLSPVQDHLNHIERLHGISLRIEDLLSSQLQQGRPIEDSDIAHLREEVKRAAAAAPDVNPDILQRLHSLETLLTSSGHPAREILLQADNRLRQIQNQERTLHGDLVDIVARDSRLEFQLAVLLLFLLPSLTLFSFYLLRNRIKRPLDDLNSLLRRLAARDYRPVAETQVAESAGLIQPVYRSYNALVNRLAELETEHRTLQMSLEQDVRRATSALLQQAGDLARAEKLAAVGELSAALAHEIRNPLAGIQLACTKLGRQLPPDQQQKIELVVSELKRVNSLLSERLYDARHAPESLVDVDVAELIGSLTALLNYQVPENIDLLTEVEPRLCCSLPESGLRQCMLNLVMNAAKAIGEGEGRISLFARRAGERLEIGVSDDGPGFPQSMIDQGVRPFVTGRVDGTGLGLAIVQRFVRTFSGELRMENRSAGGACVTLILPCHESRRPASAGDSESDNRGVINA